MAASKSKLSLAERFWSKVDKADGDACWLWTRARFTRGYGKFAPCSYELEGAHRMAWVLTHGPIPDGLWVLHKCDTRPCCRPDHLFLGTRQDNVDDMVAKGRNNGGFTPSSRKLLTDQVIEVRTRIARGESQRAVGRLFGLDHRNIGRIITRETYRNC